ncbi:MAG: hypothetical protein GY865_16080, partial [candidate division Zixibacteria bacterium]|nr:hypothetical protein [candidate division Zixibacteria bacterium]
MRNIRKTTIFSTIAFTFLLAIVISGNPNSLCHAQSDSTEFDPFSINDGPYIIQQSSSANIAFYVCDGFFESRSFGVVDTIKFNGFCYDTNEVYTVTTKNYTIEPDIIDNISKIVSISDLHGRYDLFVDILIKSKVINIDRQWIFGDGHLVINGDVFDRGAYVTECLWLIYRLEQEAKKVGGAVHFILGNHELMVLRADNRYINEKYLKGVAEITAINHEDIFGKRSALGQWLRSKHTVIKINNILFTHGGIAPSLIDKKLSIQNINSEVRKNIDFVRKSPEVSELARYLFGGEGPFWYRGYFYDMEKYSKTTTEDIDNIISYFDVHTIVVGHSGMDEISGFYDNRVINEHKTLDSA